jgi:hypothetical protein
VDPLPQSPIASPALLSSHRLSQCVAPLVSETSAAVDKGGRWKLE